ncbi:hypothetical protein NC653_004592 [Populus alba x Populus x berolinensis]|uniref:Uncharacterized protein n=1 Tax=Populus alba x Populus x berolinensis TaxID=444605 RepID=A0AAD6RUE3_9ROSI|nr:hypothetical protein NC653_004592 [Populus alba x Populus x berolinensis]
MPEEVVRINLGLHLYQPVEGTGFNKACVALLVNPQIKVPVIDICLPWKHGNIRRHVIVKPPDPIYML